MKTAADEGKDTLCALLGLIEDAFLTFSVPRFSPSLRVREAGPRKIHCMDPGLAWAVSHVSTRDVGPRLENAVYLELRRRSVGRREGSISRYVSSRDHEVDFVIGVPDELAAARLIQVCADLGAAGTREREVRAVTEAMTELRLSEAVIVTLHEREQIEVVAGTIQVMPAWQWMLGAVLP